MITGLHYLRAIAAMLVVSHHANSFFTDHAHWPTFGEAGVDIFFVISGFVMAWTTQNTAKAPSARHAAWLFLLRRLIRVVPLYWLALLWLLKQDILRQDVDPQVLQDFLFLPRFSPDHPGHIYPVLVPGWTINYEIFFYAIFTLAILFRHHKHAIVFGVLAFTITLGYLVDFQSASGLFYTSPIVAEFLYGILLCKLVQRYGLNHFRHLSWAVLLGGFAWLVSTSHLHLSRAWAIGPVAALIVYAAMLAFNGRRIAWLHHLADASFSIYLTHQVTFRISRMLLQGLSPDQPSPAAIALSTGVHLSVAAIVGLMVHWWLEKPITAWLNQRILTPRTNLGHAERPTPGV